SGGSQFPEGWPLSKAATWDDLLSWDHHLIQKHRNEARAAIAAMQPRPPSTLLEAIRRHIRSFEPGTLVGSGLNVAHELHAVDGDVWKPWTVPGEMIVEESVAMQPQPTAPDREGKLVEVAKRIWAALFTKGGNWEKLHPVKQGQLIEIAG